ncbi:MAG: MCP four helix bundle domain-containing protein, partial [Eubacteriales bacterium]
MKNLKIGKKLLLAFMAVLIGLAAISAYGLFSINTITAADETMYNKNLKAVGGISDMTEAFYLLRVTGVKTVYELFTPDGATSLQKKLDDTKTKFNTMYDDYSKTIVEQEDQANLDTLKADMTDYESHLDKLIAIIKANDSAALKVEMPLAAVASTKVADLLNTMSAYNDKQAEMTMNGNKSLGNTSNLVMLLVAVGIALIAVYLAITVTLGITRPVKRLVAAADKMAAGDMDVDIIVRNNDEIGLLAKSFVLMVGSIRKLIADANMLAQAAVEGKLSTRADATQHQGDFKKIVEGVNNTLDSVMQPLNVAAGQLEKMANGDDMDLFDTDEFNGDYKVIITNLNGARNALYGMLGDSIMLAEAAAEGKLSTRADLSKHKGGYRQLVEGINNT